MVQVVYGLVYGIGTKSLSVQLGVTEDEAARFIENFKVSPNFFLLETSLQRSFLLISVTG
jgi:DNA polymerase I-like protein with 3'-5' exonuclease and polymerase domains